MRVAIDRIVLDGLPWEEADAARFREALGQELSRLLDARTPHADAAAPGPLVLAPGAPTDPAGLARQVAGHLAGALSGVKG